MSTRLHDVPTPALVVDEPRLQRNLDRMSARARELGVVLRPHVKTLKCPEIARRAVGTRGAVAVSTLREARTFAEEGFADLTLAIGITPSKVREAADVAHEGARLTLVVDDLIGARGVADRARAIGSRHPVLIEIDCGARRGGIPPEDPLLVDVARTIADAPELELAGVMTHAGHSYAGGGPDVLARVAAAERDAVVASATRLRAADLPCPTVSVGSTPTALLARDLTGVTEMRPGVYMAFDYYQHGLGLCDEDDVAVSVLATVITHRRESGYALVDAGALALSKDRSCEAFGWALGYGPVFDVTGRRRLGDVVVADAHQEHGFLRSPSGRLPFDAIPVGTPVRIFPNHACMMAAPYDRLVVADGDRVIGEWPKVTGW